MLSQEFQQHLAGLGSSNSLHPPEAAEQLQGQDLHSQTERRGTNPEFWNVSSPPLPAAALSKAPKDTAPAVTPLQWQCWVSPAQGLGMLLASGDELQICLSQRVQNPCGNSVNHIIPGFLWGFYQLCPWPGWTLGLGHARGGSGWDLGIPPNPTIPRFHNVHVP